MTKRPAPAKSSPAAGNQRRAKGAPIKPAKSVLLKAPSEAQNNKTAVKVKKLKKSKMVRDSFAMPESEYALIVGIKKRCIAQGLAVKKSEVLRAAVAGFASQSDEYIKSALSALAVIKTGRPPKHQK
jgi:hypothetical protein